MNLKQLSILHTKQLLLRTIEVADREAIFSLRSNKEVNLYLDRKPAAIVEDADLFIQKILESIAKEQSFYWVICLEEKVIGTICLFQFDATVQQAEIGFELLPDYMGKGYMLEALQKVQEYAGIALQLKSIVAFTHPENAGSIKLLQKAGFLPVAEKDPDAPLLQGFRFFVQLQQACS